jgi:hypothetical protein
MNPDGGVIAMASVAATAPSSNRNCDRDRDPDFDRMATFDHLPNEMTTACLEYLG